MEPVREPRLFSRGSIRYAVVSAAAYFFAIDACYWAFDFVRGIELRPATCLAVVSGMLWGAHGALGIAAGNAALVAVRGIGFWDIVLSSVANFFLAYIPYRIWWALDGGRRFICDRRTFALFVSSVVLAGSVAAAVIVCLIVMLYGISPRETAIFIWGAQVIFPIALGIPIISLLRTRVESYRPREGAVSALPCPPVVGVAIAAALAAYLWGIGSGAIADPHAAPVLALSIAAGIYLSTLPPRGSDDGPASATIGGAITVNFLIVGVMYAVYDCVRVGTLVIGQYHGAGDEAFWRAMAEELFGSLCFIFLGIYLVLGFVERSIFSRVASLGRRAADFVRTGEIWEGGADIDGAGGSGRGDEIDSLASAYSKMTADIRSYVAEMEMMIRERESMHAQLAVASEIQMGIVPRAPLACAAVEIAADMRPAREVGGDLYDYFMIDASHIGIVIGDVSGKGVPAALFMSMAKMGIKICAEMGMPPARVFEMTNDMLCESNERMLFVTAWMGSLDIETGELVSVAAGHCPPMVLRGGGRFEPLVPKKSLALAVMEGRAYSEERTRLAPGDTILLYTDGVTEAHAPDAELFGSARLARAASSRADAPLDELLGEIERAVDAHADGTEQFDDITLLALRFRGI